MTVDVRMAQTSFLLEYKNKRKALFEEHKFEARSIISLVDLTLILTLTLALTLSIPYPPMNGVLDQPKMRREPASEKIIEDPSRKRKKIIDVRDEVKKVVPRKDLRSSRPGEASRFMPNVGTQKEEDRKHEKRARVRHRQWQR
jgi:hypothetical protein